MSILYIFFSIYTSYKKHLHLQTFDQATVFVEKNQKNGFKFDT